MTIRRFAEEIFELSVIAIAICIVIGTVGGIYMFHLDGRVFRPAIVYYAPHPITAWPIQDHPPMPRARGGITHLTEKSFYYPGDMVCGWVDVDKLRNIQSTITWSLVDHRTYPYAARPGILKMGRSHQLVPLERLDTHIPPGEYEFIGVSNFPVNFLTSVPYSVRSNKFTVLSKGMEVRNETGCIGSP